MNDIGWGPKPGEAEEQSVLRHLVFHSLGYDARDPKALAEARELADKTLEDPNAIDPELASNALSLTALSGDQTFYDKVMAALKNAKSPEDFYMYQSTLAQFTDPNLLQRTLDYAVSSDVRSQDALSLVARVMRNPAGEKLAWNFVQTQWDAVQKAGGPFASAEVVAATGSFCSAKIRDEVTSFYEAHKIAAAERTYRQSIERINGCIDLKSEQEPQLASYLETRTGVSSGQSR
jgi:aminopeptidase N